MALRHRTDEEADGAAAERDERFNAPEMPFEDAVRKLLRARPKKDALSPDEEAASGTT